MPDRSDRAVNPSCDHWTFALRATAGLQVGAPLTKSWTLTPGQDGTVRP